MLLSKNQNCPMCNSNHHSSEKYIKALFIVPCCIVLRQSIKKKNIHGIRIKSVVYLDFEMQQKISGHSSS